MPQRMDGGLLLNACFLIILLNPVAHRSRVIDVPLRAIKTSSYSGCASRTCRYALSAASACFTSGTTRSFLPFPCLTVISRLAKSISPSFKLTSSLTRRPVCRKSMTMAKSRVFPPATCRRALYSVLRRMAGSRSSRIGPSIVSDGLPKIIWLSLRNFRNPLIATSLRFRVRPLFCGLPGGS